jgi:hypothetical protein
MDVKQQVEAIFSRYESRIAHWGNVLSETTSLPEDLITHVATVLTKDELQGLSARTPHDLAIMARAAEFTSLPR